ncbi:MAG: hypothetical protein ACRCTI_20570 [Beijerinckiaceae bacterium]
MTGAGRAAAGAAFALMLGIIPAQSAVLAPGMGVVAKPLIVSPAQHSYSSRGFRRCMRAKYGPRHFARVPRTVRWHMAQACM